MNKIVIIGNGFDIAHRLPTKYEDFMNYIKDSIVKKRILGNGGWNYETFGVKNVSGFIHKLTEGKKDPWIGARINDKSGECQLGTNPNSSSASIYFQSLIDKEENLGYWSDLESHYFKLLNVHNTNLESVKTINKEFDHLKMLLNEYLKTEIENKIGNNTEIKIDRNNRIYQMLISQSHNDYEFDKHYFVSFNYTSKILQQYVTWLRRLKTEPKVPIDPIHIHGDLINHDNPIIFGYGDDNSDEYRKLQNIKEKEVLKNFKTFQYLRSKRYRQILGLLEDQDEIYIQIIGHSCDIGDKTLLRTIFEHRNVKHIETTYHDNESRYFENLYNISRIFDENSLMREKLIPLEETYKITQN